MSNALKNILTSTPTAGLKHDAFTYGAALEACGRLGNWGQAEVVVGQMAEAYADSIAGHGGDGGAGKSTLSPSAVHCNALLNAYCRGDRWGGCIGAGLCILKIKKCIYSMLTLAQLGGQNY